MGSRSVMFRAYATKLPAAEPLPGPTGIPLFFAKWMKSATIKKYPEYPMDLMIVSSSSRRGR